MKILTNSQINTVSGAGGDIGREIAQGLGAGAGTYVGGTPGGHCWWNSCGTGV
ncbi:colicin V family bacteriocin [Enterobacter cancerogenus]|uniref:colicin V family bacteriocin n=1 Tax=Enterobacter cancerogenus TaxID=69218 RepID=UPI00244DA78A|nr:colicin V family bacteriocin [Enterobacter cancerogenus]